MYWLTLYHRLDEMAEAAEASETTSAAVKARIDELNKRHRQDMQDLYEYDAQQYLDEALDRYMSKDDMVQDVDIDVCVSLCI